ncbi:hypothetical protein [Halomonas alkalisoli]|uniref:hypothetical protein n=1 Tax=Halomonas alkalisoli TaxID=2907158 RepID=UPI001F3C8414|nr:hypothetical protein [Halomonas alkalisoli]MCE9681652.1 hypothetical protein [Halomonas alkalisoli]
MAVNRYKDHLVIYLEDQPYRGIVNGVKTLPNVNDRVIDVRPPCGGWGKVFAELQDNLALLNARQKMHALLLMDFDNDFQARKARFDSFLDKQACRDRVFLLGVDEKESEDLKAALRQSNNEAVGKMLVRACPEQRTQDWENRHLYNNADELNRMVAAGVFRWLFVRGA